MKLLAAAALNLILPFYLFTSSVATLTVDGETHSSEKETNLQLLMKSSPHNKLPPAVQFGLQRHLIHKNQQNVRHAEEDGFFTPCMTDLLEKADIQLAYALAVLDEASLSASEFCNADGTSCTMDWSNVDLSAGEDVCKQNDMELYLVDAEMDGCLAETNDDFAFNNTGDDYKYGDDFAFNNTGDDYKYSYDDPADSAESVSLIDYPLGCVPTSCDKEEVVELFLPTYESCETVVVENVFLSSSTSGSMNPFNKKNQGIGISLMIAGIIGTYA